MIMISWWSRLIESMRIPSIKRKLPCFKHSMRTWWIRKDLRLESDSLISFMYEWEWSSLFYRWFLSIIWTAFISERGTVIRLMYVVGCDGFIGNRRICNQKVLILIFRPILQLVSSLVVMYPSRIEIPKDCRFITVARGWTRWALLRRIPMETKAFLQHIFFFLFFFYCVSFILNITWWRTNWNHLPFSFLFEVDCGGYSSIFSSLSPFMTRIITMATLPYPSWMVMWLIIL